jgi:hypothetical protein
MYKRVILPSVATIRELSHQPITYPPETKKIRQLEMNMIPRNLFPVLVVAALCCCCHVADGKPFPVLVVAALCHVADAAGKVPFPVLVATTTTLLATLADATTICKTFSLSCIQSLQPLPPIIHSPQQQQYPQQQPQQLDQVVWFDSDDDGAEDDDAEDDNHHHQVDDYTAIEGLGSHHDISELVWMEADDEGHDDDDNVQLSVHSLRMTAGHSWPAAAAGAVSPLIDALQRTTTTSGESPRPAQSSTFAAGGLPTTADEGSASAAVSTPTATTTMRPPALASST